MAPDRPAADWGLSKEDRALLQANLRRTGRWLAWLLAVATLLTLGRWIVWPYLVARCAGRGADLAGAPLLLAPLRGADLVGANLRRANLCKADLSGADLTATELQNANMQGAHLTGTRLVDTHLEGADLRGADLSQAIFGSVHLEGACYDLSTRWPTRRGPGEIIPQRLGAVLVATGAEEGKRLSARQPRYSREEVAQRGTEIYNRDIRPLVEKGNEGKIVAIDVETGAYELGKGIVTTSDRLLARSPDAQIWYVRVGHPAVHHIRRHLESAGRRSLPSP